MSEFSYLEKLLDGVEVKWLPLGHIAAIKTGQSVNKNMISKNPGVYPVINSGREPLGFINTWNTDNDPIGITTRGAGVGSVIWQEGKYFRGNLNYSITIDKKSHINIRYMYHALLHMKNDIHELCTFDGIPALNAGSLKKLLIPIPCPNNPEKSLAIQSEIVRILDKFTALTAELTAELTMRKKQYNYYRDKLLSFEEGGVEWKTLGEIVKMRAGQHISARNIVDGKEGDFVYPCFGGNGIRGYVKEKSHDGEHLLIGRQGALCGNVQRMKGQFYATEHAVVVSAMQGIDIDWAFHMLTTMNLNQYASKSAQPGLAVGKLQELKLLVPSIERQKYIAKILDKFDTLTSSITEGLPREIELRQKQYEYYRDLLFSFPKPETASN